MSTRNILPVFFIIFRIKTVKVLKMLRVVTVQTEKTWMRDPYVAEGREKETK